MLNLNFIVDSELFNTLLQMFNVSLEFISFSFLDENLFRVINLNIVLVLFTLGIFVFDIKYTEQSILASREKNLIIKTYSESFNW